MTKSRIGIIGGMGPLAGVELHRLIVTMTPAHCDQDHLEVLLYTNPTIPDRTQSLANDGGKRYAVEVGKAALLLEKAGVDLIAIACMTAHARFDAIQDFTRVPILHGVKLTRAALQRQYSRKKIALLATDGSLKSGVFTSNSPDIDWLVPRGSIQQAIMQIIYNIKSGHNLRQCANTLVALLKTDMEADTYVLGCTELGLIFDHLRNTGLDVVDPLRVLAGEIVSQATKAHARQVRTLHANSPITRDKQPILC